MWDNYYDAVLYKRYKQKDSFGNSEFDEAIPKVMRYVRGYDRHIRDDSGESIEYARIYHSPFELYQKDNIDNMEVVQVQPIRGIFGDIHYWKVWVS